VGAGGGFIMRDTRLEQDEVATGIPVIGGARWLTPERIDAPELLDQPGNELRDIETSLNDLWRINRYLGGLRALTCHLFPRLRTAGGAVTCLDLGAGAAQIAHVVDRWAQRERCAVRVVSLDVSLQHLHIARKRSGFPASALPVQADATWLPFAPRSVDYVVSSLFLHHFAPDAAISLLRSATAIARRGLVMTDLVRAWPPLLGFKALQPVIGRSVITRHDAVVSIRRGYTPGELTDLARAAGLPSPRVHRHFPWRMTLVADK